MKKISQKNMDILRRHGVVDKNGKYECSGDLDLRGTGITALPEGLTVSGWLDLSDTGITVLPEGLTVSGWLYLRGTGITALPEGLTVSGDLYLRGTGITALPEGLTVSGDLDLRGTGITALPEGLTVSGWLNLSDTGITVLPEGLTVGGWLDLFGTGITDTSMVKRIDDNAIIEWSTGYAKVDGIFGKIIRKRGDVWKMQYISGDVFYIVSNGEKHAHGKTIRDAENDLAFKCADRDVEQYRGMTADSVLSFFDAQVCYRNITGACLKGIRQFLKNKIAEPKTEYTIAEIIELTNGQYRSDVFAAFFNGEQ